MGAGTRPREWLKRGIELRHFAALGAVADGASFSRAAVALGYTQSAVSQQIAALERIVGVKLVERPGGQRSVTLTEAGAMLLAHAHAIGMRLAAAEADLEALLEGSLGTLRVGSFQAAGARILPEALRRFLAAMPDVHVDLTEAVTDGDLVAQVERGELDLAFVVDPVRGGALESARLLRDPFFLIVPAGRSLSDLAGGQTNGRLHLPVVCFRSCDVTREVLGYLRESTASTPRSSSPPTTTRRCRGPSPPGSVQQSCRASRSTSRIRRPSSSSSGPGRRPGRYRSSGMEAGRCTPRRTPS